jgi:hypothetical protein
VFFSFHYQRDIFRVNTVRHSDVTKKNVEQAGYWDHSLWEESKKKGADALMKLISDGLVNTSVTAVLAGAETATRPWVRYELVKSFERGNGLTTVYVNQIRDTPTGSTDVRGPDPLKQLYFTLAADERTATVVQHTAGTWQAYMTIDAGKIAPAAKAAGKGFLSVAAQAYDWVTDDGYRNFAQWVEQAARSAGRA